MREKDMSLRLLKEIVRESPADQTEAILQTEDSSLTRFTQSTVHQHVAERNRTVTLRVVLGKKIAVVTTNILRPSSLRDSLKKAISFAEAQEENADFKSLPEPKPIPVVDTYSKNVTSLTPQRKVEMVKDIFRILKGKGLRASGAFSNGTVELAVVNSLGVEASQKYSDLFLHLIAQGEKGTGYGSFVARDPEALDIKALAEETAGKVWNKEPLDIEPGEYEVILEPAAVSECLSFLGYLGLHALAVQEGRSFFCNRIGTKMVDDKVTIYDDGLDPEGLQIPFDFEGTPKEKVVFFEKGIATGVTYDCFTAGREGKRSTGHGLLPPNTAGPIPINLFMKEGESTIEEMIRSVRKGIYVTRFHYTNVVEPMNAVLTGMTRDGTFLIEGGEIKGPVKNLRFTESVLRALSRVGAVCRSRRICSEGTVYSRRFVTGVVSPAIKVDGFNFSGVSAL